MIRVMITDDHLIVREGLRLILETADGIEIAGEASDGAECLALVPECRPDVILMDLQMPRMDGITERTVKAHLASIYQKFNVDSRAAAVAVAAQKGLLGE